MSPHDIPDRLYIGPPGAEELWSVQWRIIDGAWALCDFDARTIEIDERLRHDPTRLREAWTHELMHAAAAYAIRGKLRRRWAPLEEDAITAIAPILAYALAQGQGRR